MKQIKGVLSFLGLFFWGLFSLVCGLIGYILIFIGFVIGWIGWIGDLITWIARVVKRGGKSLVDFADRIALRKE